MEDAHHPQHPEHHEAGEEEEGQDGQQIDHAVVGPEEPQDGLAAADAGVQVIRRPDPQGVLHAEQGHRYQLYRLKNAVPGGQLLKGLQEHGQDIQQDHGHQTHVKDPAGQIVHPSDLDDLKDAPPHALLFHRPLPLFLGWILPLLYTLRRPCAIVFSAAALPLYKAAAFCYNNGV